MAVAITLASALFTWRSNHSPLWALAAGGALGWLLLR